MKTEELASFCQKAYHSTHSDILIVSCTPTKKANFTGLKFSYNVNVGLLFIKV